MSAARSRTRLMTVLVWGLGPLAVAALASMLAAVVAGDQRGALFGATAKLSAAERQRLELSPTLSIANAAWRLGSGPSAKRALKAALDELPDSGPLRARTLLRFAAVDQNPEGQAAVIGQACNADPSICEHLKEATASETSTRLTSPGNHLPLYFLEGHPPILGR
jgi:hypothetical protein